MSAAMKFTREIFFRVRERLKQSVRVNIIGCNHASNGDVFIVEKYRRADTTGYVKRSRTKDVLSNSFVRLDDS
ncbi:hypothetical protein AHAS_Ahas02G0167000 [Arachis hypogaea]